ncbi:MAG: NAD-dependent epimerase/dehydratase family protein [Tissierella sp.]|uniref:NAD-dependent epimerase/dehydratase family protein n=1 Tax=Tissierella sp. TaxID=41274 RepID=UPI003F9DFE41
MKVLVTGALGNVGRNVLRELLSKGEDVVVAVAGTNIKRLEKLFEDKVTAVAFDFTEHNTYDKALKQVTVCF